MLNRRQALATLGALIASPALGDVRPKTGVTEENVDLVEYNNLYSDEGNGTLDQIILWNWEAHDAAFRCCGWIKVPTHCVIKKYGDITQKDQEPDSQNIVSRLPDGRYRTIISDLRNTRIIMSNLFRETWTQYDPEVEDRKFVPTNLRHKPPCSNK